MSNAIINDQSAIELPVIRLVRFRDLVVLFFSVALGLTYLLRLWEFHPHIPIAYNGDGLSVIAGFQNMRTEGWYFYSSHVGFPFGQHLQDFPAIADNLLLFISWLLVRITNSPVLTFNVFYLGTYFVNALGGYIGARWAGVKSPQSIAIGVLYTFLPYHFIQGPGHIYLVMYAVIPIMIGWIIQNLNRLDGATSNSKLQSIGIPLGLGILSATCGLYYAAFILILLGWGILKLCGRGSFQSAKRFLLTAVTLISSVVLQFVPIVIYQMNNGSNLSIAKRQPFEVEYYSLRFIDLVLPIPQHRLHFLANISSKGTSNFLPGESSEFLGVLGALGVVALALALVFRSTKFKIFQEISFESEMFLILFLFGTVGGINQMLATVGFVQIRVWSRISVAIGFLALLAILKIVKSQTYFVMKSRVLASSCLVFLSVISILDTNPTFDGKTYVTTSNSWHNDQRLTNDIETTFGQGARIFQIPNVRFPEQGPINGLEDYAEIRGYIHSTSLCWSYGVITGRDSSRTNKLVTKSVDEYLQVARSEHFDVLWIELRAFEDHGADIVAQIQHVLGKPSFLDNFNQVAIFDLTPDILSKREDCHK